LPTIDNMVDTEQSNGWWRIHENRLIVVPLAVVCLVVLGVVLRAAQSVILPLIVAWLLSYILGPVVTRLTRWRIPTSAAVTVVVLLLFGLVYLGAVFLNARIGAFLDAYPKYQQQLQQVIDDLAARWNVKYNPLETINWPEKVGAFLVRLSGSLFVFLSKLVMVIIFLVFMLLGKPYYRYKLRAAFAPRFASQIDSLLTSVSSEIGRYLSTQFLISFATGLLVWLVLLLIGVDFALTFGAAAFVLNFIPTIGSIIASIPPVLLALVEFYPRVWPGVMTLLALLAIQMTIGNFISPKVMGDKLNLSPVVVLLSLVFWGWLWGVTGALLSVPIASAIKIFCANFEPLRPISILMGSGKSYRDHFSAG
jgi:predicted PurR-regulated permease PerM